MTEVTEQGSAPRPEGERTAVLGVGWSSFAQPTHAGAGAGVRPGGVTAPDHAPAVAEDGLDWTDEAGDSAEGSAAEDRTAEGGTVERIQAAAGAVVERTADAVEQAADRLRNKAELTAERGITSIADEVVEKIAGIAAREIPGVHDLGGDVSRFFSAVKDRVGLGDGDDDQGVRVRLDGSTAVVEITMVIEYGFVVHSVTEKVRANVIGAVENMLGLEVTAVDIRVDDVHVPDQSGG